MEAAFATRDTPQSPLGPPAIQYTNGAPTKPTHQETWAPMMSGEKTIESTGASGKT